MFSRFFKRLNCYQTFIPKHPVQSNTAEIFWARRSFNRSRGFPKNERK